MIIANWRVSIAPGKLNKGLAWAKKTMEYQKKEGILPPKWWILRPRTGDTSTRFSMVGEFASFEEFEKHEEKRNAGPEFQALQKEMWESGWYGGVEIIISQVVEEG